MNHLYEPSVTLRTGMESPSLRTCGTHTSDEHQPC